LLSIAASWSLKKDEQMLVAVLTASIILLSCPVSAIARTGTADDGTLEGKKLGLLADLKALEAEGAKLDRPVARAYAIVAIADAAWYLDKAWSEKLLRDGYDLTLPDESERERLRNQPAGTNPAEPTEAAGAIMTVRNWAMRLASRDKAFFDKMSRYAKEQLGRSQQVSTSAALADAASVAGDFKTASKYVLTAADADPTQISTLGSISTIAAKDRDAADELVAVYIDRLRGLRLSGTALSRVYGFLGEAILPDPYRLTMLGVQIPPAGADTVRLYVSYVIESGNDLLKRSPSSVANLYLGLKWAWQGVQEYAPDLATPYLQLEALARAAGATFVMPSTAPLLTNPHSLLETGSRTLDVHSSTDIIRAASTAVMAGEFKEARRLLDLLPVGTERDQQIEDLNYREGISDVKKGELYDAEQLARKLFRPYHILAVYSGLVKARVKKGEGDWATSLSGEAIKRLKQTAERQDLPWMIGTFASTIAPVDEMLALGLFEDLVDAANHAGLDTSVGYPGFNVSVFTVMLPHYHERMSEDASSLKDRLQRVAALAAVYRWDVENLKAAADHSERDKAAKAKTP
jgi:hypothetical protein